MALIPPKKLKPPSVWIFADQRKVGTENQCRGLVEALGFPYEVWHFSKPHWPLSWFPRSFWPLKAIPSETRKLLLPPWPAVLVAAGHTAVAAAAKVRALSQGRSFVIVLQNPHLSLKKFDLVIAPQHDNLKGENFIESLGALHNVTSEKIHQAAHDWRDQFSFLPQPLVAVLIGGPTRHFAFDAQIFTQMIAELKELHLKTGVGFLVTCSRRTPGVLRDKLKTSLRDIPSFYWDGEGKNPYLAYLGAADYIIVTADSVSMLSEAMATDKPLYVYPLPGKSKKFTQFHTSLFNLGIARPFQGELIFWARSPHQEPQRMAHEVKKRLTSLS